MSDIWCENTATSKESNEGNKGIVIITWKNISDDTIQRIISNLYRENTNAIEGMSYREYGSEMSDKIKQIPDFVEGKLDKKLEKKPVQMTLEV